MTMYDEYSGLASLIIQRELKGAVSSVVTVQCNSVVSKAELLYAPEIVCCLSRM